MKKIVFEGLRGIVKLAGLVGMAGLFVAGTCTPPPAGPDLYTCTARCQDGTGPDYLKSSDGYCSDSANYQSDCTQLLTNGGTACNTYTYVLVQAGGCPGGTAQGYGLSGGVHNSSEASLDYDESFATLSYNGQPEMILHVSGDVKFTGGCERVSCGISFNHMRFTTDDFSVTVSGTVYQVTDILILNDGVMAGSQAANSFSIPSAQVKMVVNADKDGVHHVLEYTPVSGQNLTGFYRPSTGEFRLSGHFYSTSGTASDLQLDLHGTAWSRPPVANAGPDQTVVRNPLTNLASLTLNGSGSSDLDSDLMEIRWYEGSTYLGSGTTKAVTLGLGTHTVTAMAIDATGKSSTDTVTVTVQ